MAGHYCNIMNTISLGPCNCCHSQKYRNDYYNRIVPGRYSLLNKAETKEEVDSIAKVVGYTKEEYLRDKFNQFIEKWKGQKRIDVGYNRKELFELFTAGYDLAKEEIKNANSIL